MCPDDRLNRIRGAIFTSVISLFLSFIFQLCFSSTCLSCCKKSDIVSQAAPNKTIFENNIKLEKRQLILLVL